MDGPPKSSILPTTTEAQLTTSSRWVCELADYHFTLHHKPGSSHVKADFLSQPLGINKGEQDNEDIDILPEHHFCALHLQTPEADETLNLSAYLPLLVIIVVTF